MDQISVLVVESEAFKQDQQTVKKVIKNETQKKEKDILSDLDSSSVESELENIIEIKKEANPEKRMKVQPSQITTVKQQESQKKVEVKIEPKKPEDQKVAKVAETTTPTPTNTPVKESKNQRKKRMRKE